MSGGFRIEGHTSHSSQHLVGVAYRIAIEKAKEKAQPCPVWLASSSEAAPPPAQWAGNIGFALATATATCNWVMSSLLVLYSAEEIKWECELRTGLVDTAALFWCALWECKTIPVYGGVWVERRFLSALCSLHSVQTKGNEHHLKLPNHMVAATRPQAAPGISMVQSIRGAQRA